MSDIKIENSTVKNSISGDNNSLTVGKTGWFLSGLVLPIIVALVVEFIKQGTVSQELSLLINIFS